MNMTDDEVRHLIFLQHCNVEGVGFAGEAVHLSFKSKEGRDSFTRKTIAGRPIIRGGYKDSDGNKYFANKGRSYYYKRSATRWNNK